MDWLEVRTEEDLASGSLAVDRRDSDVTRLRMFITEEKYFIHSKLFVGCFDFYKFIDIIILERITICNRGSSKGRWE